MSRNTHLAKDLDNCLVCFPFARLGCYTNLDGLFIYRDDALAALVGSGLDIAVHVERAFGGFFRPGDVPDGAC